MGLWVGQLGGVNRTSYMLPLADLTIVNRGHHGVGTASIPIWDPTGALSLTNELAVRFTHDGVEFFEGFVRRIRRSDHEGRSTGPRIATLECQDFTTLLDDDVIDTAYRSAAESDKQRVTWLVQTFGTRGVTAGAEVQQLLASMPPGSDNRPEQDFGGKTLRRAIEQVAAISGATFYVDYDKKLHYFSTESVASPFHLSDTPNGSTTRAYGDLVVTDDSTDLVHEVLVRGTGVSAVRLVASPPPVADRRRAVLNMPELTTVLECQTVGDAFLAEHGAVRRRATLTTWTPGLRAGMTVQLTHQGHGLASVSFRIAQVTANPVGADKVAFHLDLADPEADLGVITGGRGSLGGRLEVAQQIAAQAARELADLGIGGGNLLRDSSHETGNGWHAGAMWTARYQPAAPETAHHGERVARLEANGGAATSGELVSI